MSGKTKVIIALVVAFLATCIACGDHQRMSYLCGESLRWLREFLN